MISIPQHISDLSPYKPGKSSDPLSYAHYKAILSSNENNFGPSPLAQKAITKALDTMHLYPDPQGDHLIDKLSIKHDQHKDEFILSNGLDGLLYSLFKAFTVSGNEVLTNENSFIAFNKFAKMNRLHLKLIPNKDYVFDLEGMLNAISKETKIVYLCNPNNPTGAHISAKFLQHFLDHVPEHILVVVDEAYYDYALDIDPTFPDSSKFEHTNILTLRTFSKLYGLAGIRIGYGIASKHIIDALKKVKLVFNPNTLAQVGALAALDDKEHIKKTISNNSKWIKIIEDQLKSKEIRFVKSYANFVCTIFKSEPEAKSFFDYMDQHNVLLRKLDGFSMPEAVRISIGNAKEMEYFSEVLQGF